MEAFCMNKKFAVISFIQFKKKKKAAVLLHQTGLFYITSESF